MDIETILGNLAMIVDNGPCRSHPMPPAHLAATAPAPAGMLLGGTDMLLHEVATRDPRDVMFMLLSLILDLWRRNEYMYLVLQQHVTRADPQLTAMIAAHSDMLGEFEADRAWKERAEFASKVVHRLLTETQPHHMKHLEEIGRPVRGRVEQEERDRLNHPKHDHAQP